MTGELSRELTDDQVHELFAGGLGDEWTTVVYRSDGLRRVKSTRAVADETAVSVTILFDDMNSLELAEAAHRHADRALHDAGVLIRIALVDRAGHAH